MDIGVSMLKRGCQSGRFLLAKILVAPLHDSIRWQRNMKCCLPTLTLYRCNGPPHVRATNGSHRLKNQKTSTQRRRFQMWFAERNSASSRFLAKGRTGIISYRLFPWFSPLLSIDAGSVNKCVGSKKFPKIKALKSEHKKNGQKLEKKMRLELACYSLDAPPTKGLHPVANTSRSSLICRHEKSRLIITRS